MRILTGIITISDRASRGLYRDFSGPALKKAVEGHGWEVLGELLVPDERPEIQAAVKAHLARGCALILCTGGTGVSPRDVTPEALRELSNRELSGFGEVMRAKSLRFTPNAILSRSLAVAVGSTLVVALPGKPAAAVQCLGFVAAAIPHCLEILAGGEG
jgi:molybdopterin adenylyltransferase